MFKLTSNPNLATSVDIDVGDVTPERAPRIRARFRDKYVDVRITLGSFSSWKPETIEKYVHETIEKYVHKTVEKYVHALG